MLPIVYSLPNCFKCKSLKKALMMKGIEFIEEMDVKKIVEKNITQVPMLEVDNKLLDYEAAYGWLEGEND